MADTSLFKRLGRLFSSDVVIRNIGGDQLKVADVNQIQTTGRYQTNSLIDRFSRLYIYNNKNIQPQISPNFIVSTNHVYAFLVLSLVGFLTYKRKSYFYLSFYLIFLSLILEIMHIFIPQRGFEFADLFGNLVGVIIIIILSYLFKIYENFKD